PRNPREQSEAFGLADGARLPDRPFHQAEDRGVGADAERQREDRGRRESGGAPELPDGVPAIASQLVQETEPERLAAFLLTPLDATELGVSAAARLLGRDPAPDEVVGVGLDVELQLLVHPALQA